MPWEGRRVSIGSEKAKGKKRLLAETRLPDQTAGAAEPFSLPAPRASPVAHALTDRVEPPKLVRSGDVARVQEPPGRGRDAGGVLSSAGLSAHELGP